MHPFKKIFTLAFVAVFPTFASADYQEYGDWAFVSTEDLCFIDTVSSDGTILKMRFHKVHQDAPRAAFFYNESWGMAPGTWSDESSLVHLNFSKVEKSSVIGFNINEHVVLGNIDISKSLAHLQMGLVVESAWDGWVEVNVQGAPSIGRFSAKGYLEAVTDFDQCVAERS